MRRDGRVRSRHLLIYGPPSVGKLTVANILAARHGFRVLDNHVSLDPALRLFDFGTSELAELVERLRVGYLRRRLHTLAWTSSRRSSSRTRSTVRTSSVSLKHRNRMAAQSSSCNFSPASPNSNSYVLDPSRPSTQKIRDVATLGRALQDYDLATPIQESDLRIDTSNRSPSEVADQIAHHLDLRWT